MGPRQIGGVGLSCRTFEKLWENPCGQPVATNFSRPTCQNNVEGGGGGGREDYVQCAAARLQEQNGSLLHMNSFGAIPRVERNVLACPTLKEPASL